MKNIFLGSEINIEDFYSILKHHILKVFIASLTAALFFSLFMDFYYDNKEVRGYLELSTYPYYIDENLHLLPIEPIDNVVAISHEHLLNNSKGTSDSFSVNKISNNMVEIKIYTNDIKSGKAYLKNIEKYFLLRHKNLLDLIVQGKEILLESYSLQRVKRLKFNYINSENNLRYLSNSFVILKKQKLLSCINNYVLLSGDYSLIQKYTPDMVEGRIWNEKAVLPKELLNCLNWRFDLIYLNTQLSVMKDIIKEFQKNITNTKLVTEPIVTSSSSLRKLIRNIIFFFLIVFFIIFYLILVRQRIVST